MALGRSSPRMSFRPLFPRLLRCSVRAGTSQPIHLSPHDSVRLAQPTRLSPHDQLLWCCAVSCARPPCPTLDRSAPRSARVPGQGQFGTWSCWSSARATWCYRHFRRSGAQVFGRFALVLRSSAALILSGFGPRPFGSSAALRLLLCILL